MLHCNWVLETIQDSLNTTVTCTCFLKLQHTSLQQRKLPPSICNSGRAAGLAGRKRERFTCTKMHELTFSKEKEINAASSSHILSPHAEQWWKSCVATFTPRTVKLNQMIKVDFNRKPWPFLWITNECLIYLSFFFLSALKNLAWWATTTEEKPVCLQRRTFAARWVQMCTVHEGLRTDRHQD